MNKNKITILNLASTIILQGLAFFSGPIFSGLLGKHNYGIAVVYLTWVQIASTVFSLQAAGTIALARVKFPMEDQEKYQSSVLSLSTLSYAAFSVLTVIVAMGASRWIQISIPMVLLGLVHGWGLYCVTAMNSKFTYEFKAEKNFVLSVMTSALTIGVSLLLIRMFPADTNYWGRIIGQSGVYAGIGILLCVYMLRAGKTIYNQSYWKFTLPLAVPTVFHLLSHIVLNQSDKLMLQSLVSYSAAGVYGLACTFGGVLNTLWHAFNNSWVPFYYEYTRQNQIEEMKRHAKNYIELFTILSIGFILLSREVFHLYAEPTFWEGTELVPLFAIGYYFVFLYSFPVNYEFYNKKTKTIAIGTTFAAVCNIVLNVVFILLWNIRGAVIATAVAHGLQFVFHYICAKQIQPGAFPFRVFDFIPGILAVGAACILYICTKDLWYIRWGVGGVLGIYLFIKIFKRREIF